MELKIYIFRHGLTEFNKKHIFSGWKDTNLVPEGIEGAKKVAEKLKDKKIDVAFHTHLSRSKDTLKLILEHHPECKEIIEDDRMIERSYGELEGRTHEDYIHEQGEDSYNTLLHWHKIDHLPDVEREKFIEKVGKAEYDVIHRSYDVPPPGGESVKDVEARVMPFIEYLVKMMKEKKVNVAISAHGNSMRPFRRHFEKLSIQKMMELENPWDDYFEYTIEV